MARKWEFCASEETLGRFYYTPGLASKFRAITVRYSKAVRDRPDTVKVRACLEE